MLLNSQAFGSGRYGVDLATELAQPEVATRPALLVLDEQITDTFVFGRERLGDEPTGVLCLVHGGVGSGVPKATPFRSRD